MATLNPLDNGAVSFSMEEMRNPNPPDRASMPKRIGPSVAWAAS